MVSSMLSMVMVIALLLGNFTLVPTSSWQMRSGELKFKVETKLNKPLDEKLTEEMGSTTIDNLSAEFDIRYKASEDLKKLEMQCDMLLSNNIDEPIQMIFWSNIDYSDRNIPKTLLIFKHANDDKYNVINIQSPVVNQGMTVMGMFSQFLNADTISSINNSISDSLKEKNFTITEKDGALSATMDEATLKGIIKQIALGMSEYIAPYFGVNMMVYNDTNAKSVSAIGGSDGPTSVYVSDSVIHEDIKVTTQEEIKSQFEAAISEFFTKLDTVKIFDKDALVLNTTLNDKKQPKNINYAININTNLYDLIKTFDGYISEGLSNENSDIDMTITFDYAYDKVNEDITIDYPTLTAENSIDIMKDNSMPDIDINSVNIVLNNELIQLKNKPYIDDSVVYLPLREVFNLKGITDENIIWDNGIINVKTTNGNVTLKVDSDELKRNTQTFKTGTKVLLQDGITYIPITMLGGLDIGGVTNTFFDENNNIVGCVISIHKYTPRERYNVRFSVQSDVDPMWEKYIYMASDKAGVKIDVVKMLTEQYLEQTNLIIAAGDPSVMIGRYSDEFLSRLEEMDAIYPAIKVNDEYSIIIPKVIKDTDVVFEVIKNFVELVNQ